MFTQLSVKSARRGTLLSVGAAVLALLALGALYWQLQFRTRGIPLGLPAPVPHAGATLGLNVYFDLERPAEWQAEMGSIAALGITAIKQPFYFSENFNWNAAAQLVQTAADHNLTMIPLLDGDPANQFTPPQTAEFAAWTGEFAARFGHSIRFYIIWDEPNLSAHWGNQPVNAIDYSALLAASAAAVRTADGDAVIVAAPLAPTIETGPQNLAEQFFLQQMYAAGAASAFDIAAGKPYGFNSGPDERTVDPQLTNFSRFILLREVMVAHGDESKSLWAGNWGWNSLPTDWSGPPSIWGEVTASKQVAFTIRALERAQQEWPWAGMMFLENWQPGTPTSNPSLGFAVKERPLASALATFITAKDPAIAYPGYHLASDQDPAQDYVGDWEFSPLGADIGQQADDQLLGDRISFTFWGTDVGLRVRRADFRARLYITVDGRPANSLPRDENGTTLVLTSGVKSSDILATEWIARNLPPGKHTVEIVASRGWDQWALNGFLVAYHPPQPVLLRGIWLLGGGALLLLFISLQFARRGAWRVVWAARRQRYAALHHGAQLTLAIGGAVLVTTAGWLTWGAEMGGMYRRLGDGTQLALTAAAASLYYVTPTFFLFAIALLLLFVMLVWRPEWGLVLIAFTIPFYVPPLPKPIMQYRFSPVEVFTLITFAAFVLHQAMATAAIIRTKGLQELQKWRPRLSALDTAVLIFLLIATVSLPFTAHLDVATNEWRVVIIEPALFYFLIRGLQPDEKVIWWMVDAFVLGGLVVAGFGLWQLGFNRQALITAEGGILRIQSFYGSPNNVALYLGRVLPFLAAVVIFDNGGQPWRRWLYAALMLPLGLVTFLTFSKGGLFLGLPAAVLFIFAQWQRGRGRAVWPWLLLFAALGGAGLWAVSRIPALAGRLSLFGETGVFRLNLWAASLQMIAERPWFGVGLDNFLTAYRSRYIFEAAWRDPNLSHPHNILLDLGTRLGLLGLGSGLGMIALMVQRLRRSWPVIPVERRSLAIGVGGALSAMLAHGLVDHSLFLVDLAFVFFMLLGLTRWLAATPRAAVTPVVQKSAISVKGKKSP